MSFEYKIVLNNVENQPFTLKLKKKIKEIAQIIKVRGVLVVNG